jgi:hypothetical protein
MMIEGFGADSEPANDNMPYLRESQCLGGQLQRFEHPGGDHVGQQCRIGSGSILTTPYSQTERAALEMDSFPKKSVHKSQIWIRLPENGSSF